MTSSGTSDRRESEAVEKARDILRGKAPAPSPGELLPLTKQLKDRLVKESDAVLMDLRSFSRERAGCIFEISELINSVSLERAVFLVDSTADEPFLRQTIQQAWNDLHSGSPNYASPHPQLRLFHYAEPQSQDRLLCAGCTAAFPSFSPCPGAPGAGASCA
jgi:hypothetical protein